MKRPVLHFACTALRFHTRRVDIIEVGILAICLRFTQSVSALRRILQDERHRHYQPKSKWIRRTANPATNFFAACAVHNKHNRRTSMPSAAFRLAIPAIKRPQTQALDRVVKGLFGWCWVQISDRRCATLTEAFPGYPESLRATFKVPKLGHTHFSPHPYQFFTPSFDAI